MKKAISGFIAGVVMGTAVTAHAQDAWPRQVYKFFGLTIAMTASYIGRSNVLCTATGARAVRNDSPPLPPFPAQDLP
jgi:hypothetical protein